MTQHLGTAKKSDSFVFCRGRCSHLGCVPRRTITETTSMESRIRAFEAIARPSKPWFRFYGELISPLPASK